MLTRYLDFAIDLDKVYALKLDENEMGVPSSWRDAASTFPDARQNLILRSKPMLKIFTHDPDSPLVLELNDKEFWNDVPDVSGSNNK
jgi:hypothetical protein